MRFPFDLGRAADVNRAIEVKVVDVVIELAHEQTGHGLAFVTPRAPWLW
jgi:hypothetical protein